MTRTPGKTADARTAAERRTHARQKIGSTVYIDLDEGNGGILLDISEGGFSVQAAIPLIEDELPRLRFRFLSSDDWILGSGTIAWRNESKRLAGVSFVHIPEEARHRIRQWVLLPPEAQSLRAPVSSTLISKSSVGQPGVPITEACEESLRSQASVTPTPTPAPSKSHNQLPRISSGMLKDMLVDERHRIRLHDLISDETELFCARLIQNEPSRNVLVTQKEFIKRIHRYEELTQELLPIICTGCFWGEKSHEHVWAELLERIASTAEEHDGFEQWIALQHYPALLLLYAGAIGAIANDRYSTLAELLLKPISKGMGRDHRLILRLNAPTVIEDETLANSLLGGKSIAAPVSEYLYGFLRDHLKACIPSDSHYLEVFDRFEYLFALVWTDQNVMSASLGWIPLGRFASKPTLSGPARGKDPITHVASEISAQGKEWAPLRAGLFSGSLERLLTARRRVAAFLASQS